MNPRSILLFLVALSVAAPQAAAKSTYDKILDKRIAQAEKTAKQLLEQLEKTIKAQKKLPATDSAVDMAAQTVAMQINTTMKLLRNQIRNLICDAAESIKIQADVKQQPIPDTFRAGKMGKWDKFVSKMRKILENGAKKAQKEADEFSKHAKKKWGRTMRFSVPKPKLGKIGGPGISCLQPKRKAHANVGYFDNGTAVALGDSSGSNVGFSWGNDTLGPVTGTVAVDGDGFFSIDLLADVFGQTIEVVVFDSDDPCPQENSALMSF